MSEIEAKRELELLEAQIKWTMSKKCKLPKWAKSIACMGFATELATRRIEYASRGLRK